MTELQFAVFNSGQQQFSTYHTTNIRTKAAVIHEKFHPVPVPARVLQSVILSLQ